MVAVISWSLLDGCCHFLEPTQPYYCFQLPSSLKQTASSMVGGQNFTKFFIHIRFSMKFSAICVYGTVGETNKSGAFRAQIPSQNWNGPR